VAEEAAEELFLMPSRVLTAKHSATGHSRTAAVEVDIPAIVISLAVAAALAADTRTAPTEEVEEEEEEWQVKGMVAVRRIGAEEEEEEEASTLTADRLTITAGWDPEAT
jgi:hypothetical protein